MDYEVAVSEFYRGANGPEELKSCGEIKLMTRAVLVDRRTIDIFHRDKRNTVVSRTGIQQSSDIRMLKRRQYLPLTVKVSPQSVCVQLTLKQLDRSPLLELSVGPLSEEDGS